MDDSIPRGMTAGYVAPLRLWEQRARSAVAGNIGVVQATIEHGFHGSKPKRNYVGRWEVLLRNRFDPLLDLRRNTWGVLELAPGKPGLRADIAAYFRSRHEDANWVD